jgi:hypothetical protein
MRPRFRRFGLILVLASVSLVGLTIACGGGEPTATATLNPTLVAQSPTASTPSAGTPPPTKIASATTCQSVDSSQQPVNPVNNFGPNDTVYVSAQLVNFPTGTVASAEWYKGTTLINTASVKAPKDYPTVWVSFFLKPAQPLDEGEYRVDIFLDSYKGAELFFNITNPLPTVTPEPSNTVEGSITPTEGTTTPTEGTATATAGSATPTEGTATPTPGTPTGTPSESPTASATPATTTPTATPAVTPTPGGPQSYTSQGTNSTITYPSNWSVNDSGSNVTFDLSDQKASFSIQSKQVGTNVAVEQVNGDFITSLKAAHPDLTVWDNSSSGLAGQNWLQTEYAYTGANGVYYHEIDSICVVQGTAYTMVMSAPIDKFDQIRGQYFQQMRDSFKFNTPGQ